ncbi:hypothetical protein J4Q44_G00006470, partial [Coregonus suidteri]
MYFQEMCSTSKSSARAPNSWCLRSTSPTSLPTVLSSWSYTADGTRPFATSTLLPQPTMANTIANVPKPDKGPSNKYEYFRSI